MRICPECKKAVELTPKLPRKTFLAIMSELEGMTEPELLRWRRYRMIPEAGVALALVPATARPSQPLPLGQGTPALVGLVLSLLYIRATHQE